MEFSKILNSIWPLFCNLTHLQSSLPPSLVGVEHYLAIMDITQRDRDLLRQTQQKMNSSQPFHIGNIVEYKIQDPAKYKSKSRQEQGLSKDARPPLPSVAYRSLHLDANDDSYKSLNNGGPSTRAPIDAKDLPITPSEVQSNLWLNMDRVEFDKLEWMSDKADQRYQEKLNLSIHFDSEGKVISSSPDGRESQDQQQAHDISSLVKLLDSAFQPQVTYALNVISKIATRATIGLYDAVFDENIHEILLKECLLRVRHHIDSPNETICQGALKCLRSLLCNTLIDEIFLDKLSPIKSEESDITMWLSSYQENFDIDMKDNDCVHSDAILGLIARTELLARFKYLLNTKIDPKFSGTYYDCILDILIRIARYSQDICWIINNNGFPKLIIERFLPIDIIREDLLRQSFALRSIKFLKIIAQAAKGFRQAGGQSDGQIIKLPGSLVPIVNAYYYLDCYGGNSNHHTSDTLLRIQIETLRLMKSLHPLTEFSGHMFSALTLDQGPLLQRVRALTQLSVLKRVEAPSSLDWQYAACLLDLLGTMMNHERLHAASSFIQPLWANYIRPQTMQWFNDIIRERIVPHQDVSIALYTAANIFNHCREEQAVNDFHNILLENSNKTNNPSSDSSLIYFRYLLREATSDSQLSNFHKTNGRLRDPVMLQSYGFMNFNISDQYSHKLNNIFGMNTPYILLNLYFNTLQKSYHKFQNLFRYYLDNVDLVRYMRVTSCYHKYPLSYETGVQRSLLAQLEVRILANASLLLSKYYLKSSNDNSPDSVECQMEALDLSKTQSECYSQLILHVISVIGIINPDIDHMLAIKDALVERVVFNEYLHIRLMSESYLQCDDIYKSMKFNQFNGLKYDGEFNENFSLNEADLLPMKSIYLSCEQPGRFWIFQPIIEYYSSQIRDCDESRRVKDGRWFLQNINRGTPVKLLPADCTDIDVISRVLKFNASLMHQSPSYFQTMVKQNIEEYLCLIGSVFLDDNLFLDRKMNTALWHNLEMILTAGLQFGVDKLFCDASQKISCLDLPLVDFFNKLVDQYEAASYNDIVFTNFLLLFLSPTSDKIFRKKLFSDKLESCLKPMRIAQSEVWIPSDFLTRNKETDPEIRYLIKLSKGHITKSTFLDYYRRYHAS